MLELLKKKYLTHEEIMEIIESDDEMVESMQMSICGNIHYITYDGKKYTIYRK